MVGSSTLTAATSPGRHFTFLLSLERLFSDQHQTLTEAGRNETARLRLAYDALDCIDGMRTLSFADMTTPGEARHALEQLRRALPAAVAKVVLPRCEAAVVALGQVREGFFLCDMVTERGLVGVPGISGDQVLGWDKATAQYLRIDRNSAHSFLTELEPDAEPHKFAVFAAHDGQLSPLLADLALLWVLRLLTEPWRLERHPLTALHPIQENGSARRLLNYPSPAAVDDRRTTGGGGSGLSLPPLWSFRVRPAGPGAPFRPGPRLLAGG